MATNSPPMMVKAIGPQKAEDESGIMARIAASAVSTTGRARRTVASTIASRRVEPVRHVRLDLVDQDHGVAHDHAGERDQPEQRHEAERLARRGSARATRR